MGEANQQAIEMITKLVSREPCYGETPDGQQCLYIGDAVIVAKSFALWRGPSAFAHEDGSIIVRWGGQIVRLSSNSQGSWTIDETRSDEEVGPDLSRGYATVEMHYGRLPWLAEHIRRNDFQIHPEVARKLLELLEGSNPKCFFELKAVRRGNLPPRAQDPQLRLFRAAEMAEKVARACKFKRGQLKQACFDVGEEYGISAEVVQREIRPHKQYGLDIVAEEEAQAAYDRGEIDYLGRPINP